MTATATAGKAATGKSSGTNIGHIVQVIGAVVDVEFAPERLPEINSALRVKDTSGPTPIRNVASEPSGTSWPDDARTYSLSSALRSLRNRGSSSRITWYWLFEV